MTLLRFAVAAGCAAVTACSALESSKVPPDSTYASNGEPSVDCVTTTQIRNTTVVDDRTIDFHMIGARAYRNTLPDRCPGLTDDRAFAYRLTTTQLCAIDIITVLHPVTRAPGASCGLGRFQPLARTALNH